MVLLKVDSQCLSFVPFEGNAPRAVDVDRVPPWAAAERMEVKPRLIKRFEGPSAVDRGQTHQGPAMQIGAHTGALAGLEQLSQSAVPKALDHCEQCNASLVCASSAGRHLPVASAAAWIEKTATGSLP
jgi:hypothetical protein